MKLFVLPLAIAATALWAAGCAPEPLEGFGGDGGTSANNGVDDTGGMDTGGMNNTGNFTPEFVAVANIIAPNCGQSACHGPLPNGQFSFPTGVNATTAEIQAALQNPNPTLSGNRLVTPSAPDSSEIYVRITLMDNDALRMPTTGPLQPMAIETIRAWIAAGANYPQ